MRKLFTLAVAFAAGVATVSAQEIRDMFGTDRKGKIAYGVRMGLNISNIANDYGGTSDNLKSRAGFQIGGVVDIPLFNGFYLQPGLSFTTRGARYKDTDYDYTEKYRPMFMQIPVLASFRADVGRSVNVQVNVGPHLAFGLGGKYVEDDAGDVYKYPIFGKSTDAEDRFGMKRFDFGLSFGAGVTIKERYYIGIQYDLGLVNAAIHDDYAFDDDVKLHHRNFAIQIGYNF